ncbi:glycosyltransferase [Polaribacter sp. Z022]|uniref:glycosyltransferase n=1 Tax=Polaribacter sp. Z022 TaxID=2927125 RepID=UPI0020216B66|nr:glycosyltransferase [Polaribacter sp. Z022]MCL7753094.1 glycosyltransferase family 2 protein [Polaribacter sp. Z022]
MKIFFGSVFTLVIVFFCVHVLIQSIKYKRIVPFAILIGTVCFYLLCFLNEFVFHLAWSLLLISQILFLTYVFCFMIVSLKRKKVVSNIKTDEDKNVLKYVSIVIAVHNEENVVDDTVNNLLNLNYPKDYYDITFIDDFSKDKTVEVLMNYSDQINVIDRSLTSDTNVMRGKPAAINENINTFKGELICVLDADSIIEKDFLKKLVPKFKDKNMGLVQARNIFYNKNRNFITRLTSLDIYSMQHTIYIPISSLGFGMFEGRAGIFRKDLFKKLNGYDTSLPGEDFDFGYRVSLEGYTSNYEDNVFSKEQITETFNEWLKQRKRWLGNHVLSCFKNLKPLYTNKNLSFSRKVAAFFFMINLLYAFTFNFFGPLMLINEFKYQSSYSYVFIISFSLTVFFFCSSYIFRSTKIWLIPLIPIMIIYYWGFTVIQTWVFINEKVLNIKLSYKKAFHRKPLTNEI